MCTSSKGRMAKVVESPDLVTYQVHVVILNFSKKFQW